MKSVCSLIKECFDDTIVRVLCGAVFLSLIVGPIAEGWPLGVVEGIGIIIAIIVIIAVTVGNNLIKEK